MIGSLFQWRCTTCVGQGFIRIGGGTWQGRSWSVLCMRCGQILRGSDSLVYGRVPWLGCSACGGRVCWWCCG